MENKPPPSLEQIESPLAGVNPRSLDALMAEDVGKLSEGEFDRIILELRKQRAGWIENEKLKDAKGPKAPRAAKGPKAPGTVSVDLNDLFGED